MTEVAFGRPSGDPSLALMTDESSPDDLCSQVPERSIINRDDRRGNVAARREEGQPSVPCLDKRISRVCMWPIIIPCHGGSLAPRGGDFNVFKQGVNTVTELDPLNVPDLIRYYLARRHAGWKYRVYAREYVRLLRIRRERGMADVGA